MGLVASALPQPQDRSGLSFALGAFSHDHCLECGWGKEGDMAGGTSLSLPGPGVSRFPLEPLTSALRDSLPHPQSETILMPK